MPRFSEWFVDYINYRFNNNYERQYILEKFIQLYTVNLLNPNEPIDIGAINAIGMFKLGHRYSANLHYLRLNGYWEWVTVQNESKGRLTPKGVNAFLTDEFGSAYNTEKNQHRKDQAIIASSWLAAIVAIFAILVPKIWPDDNKIYIAPYQVQKDTLIIRDTVFKKSTLVIDSLNLKSPSGSKGS